MLQLKDALGELRQAGRRLRVSHVGLHRTDAAELRFGREAAERTRQRTQLDCVSHRGTGRRRFHIPDRARINARSLRKLPSISARCASALGTP